MFGILKRLFTKEKEPEPKVEVEPIYVIPLTAQQKIYLGRVRIHLLKIQTDFYQKRLPGYVQQIQGDIARIDKILKEEQYYHTQQEWLNSLQNVINPH